MNQIEIMKARHSVRQYKNQPITEEMIKILTDEINICNEKSGLHIQLVTNEPKAFDGFMAHYGKFTGVTNYIAMIGRKGNDLEEKCGYYGEHLVLLAQSLGLNTCWVAMTYNKIKTAFSIDSGEKLFVVIAVGYGETQGVPYKSKPAESVMKAYKPVPGWFQNGIDAALLAPTAMNQQKFVFSLNGDKVSAKAGVGFYTKLDLGIVKYHFELGAGKDAFDWIG